MSETVSLDEFVRLKRGYDLPSRNREAGETPILGSFGITGWHNKPKIDGPGVTIGRSGASIGVATYHDGPCWPLNTALYVKDFKGNDARFVYYVLDSIDFTSFNSGSAQPSLNRNYLGTIDVWRPDNETQSAVARVLGSFDDLIENNRRRIEILEEMARLLYREWFVHFRFPGHEHVEMVDSELGPIPEGWEIKKFDDLVAEHKETVPASEIPDHSPVVGLEHLPRRSTTLAKWDQAFEVGSRRKTFEQGDILFGKIRPYFHKVVDAQIAGYASTDAIIFRPIDAPERSLCIASSDEFVAAAVATSNGTKMPRANTNLLLAYSIPQPPPEVSCEFEAQLRPLSKLRHNLVGQNRMLREARDLLLPRLVSGELDVSELNLDFGEDAAAEPDEGKSEG